MPNDLVFIWQCIPKSRSLKIGTSLSEEYNCSFRDASIMFWSIPNTGVTARKSSHERAIIGTLKTKIWLYLFYSCNSLWHFYKQTSHFHSFWSNFFLLFVRLEITILGIIFVKRDDKILYKCRTIFLFKKTAKLVVKRFVILWRRSVFDVCK